MVAGCADVSVHPEKQKEKWTFFGFLGFIKVLIGREG
jgi:hypothetical protein